MQAFNWAHTLNLLTTAQFSSRGEHSPAPSALILSARWNPLQEPTKLIPVRNAISNLNGLEALALSSKSFCFTRSDCFVKDESQATIAKFDSSVRC